MPLLAALLGRLLSCRKAFLPLTGKRGKFCLAAECRTIPREFYEGRAARWSHVKAHVPALMPGVRGEFQGGGGEVADE